MDGGLDLISARPAVLPGRIRECLNYETNSWERGYSRIDGWERFDGHTSPSATNYWIVVIPTVDITGVIVDQPTDLLWSLDDESGASGVMVKYDEAVGMTTIAVVFRQGRHRPPWESTITDEAGTWSFVLAKATITIAKLSTQFADHQSFITTLDAYATSLRDVVRPVPGGGTIVGLHYHEDQLYAVRDAVKISVTVGEENELLVGMYVYNAAGQLGEVVKADSEGNRFHITAVDNSGFTLIDGDRISVALTIRFITGTGAFAKGDSVDSGVWAGTVGLVERRDGSFASGNALGVAAFINGPDTPPALGATITNLTQTGSMELDSGMFAPKVNATTVLATFDKSEIASLWRSTDDGWEAATSGRILSFENGETDPESDAPVPQTSVKFGAVAAQVTNTSDPDWSNPTNILLDDGNIAQVAIAGYTPLAIPGYSDLLEIKDFKFGILDGSVITGIGVTFKGYEAFVGGIATQNITLADSSGYTRTLVLPEVAAPGVEVEAGGINSFWKAGGHTPAEINSASFGFKFFAKTFTQSTTALDVVKVTIYFNSLPGAKIYMWDGTSDIGTISVKESVVQTGDWGGPDPIPGLAAGYFRLTDWDLVDIPSGTTLYSAPGGSSGGGFLIADVVGGVSRPILPGSSLLTGNNSRYQMISYNFFATEERNAIYGVSGAGNAFWYDGTTLDFIFTGVEEGTDKPRHVAPHVNRLALGYIWGEVYVSGVEPTNFGAAEADSGVILAASFGFGDKITGLMPVSGDALAVFTESQTWVLKGVPEQFGGEALNTVSQQVVNHKVGAIEYTVQNIGNRPIFATFRGIETMETMDQYSDFFTAPLTYDISPWLLRRLQTAAGSETIDETVVNSIVIRNKNQYRLFFADGYVLTLTYVGPEKEAQTTTQKYWFNDEQDQFARVFATASGVTTAGQDRAFFSVEERPDIPSPLGVDSPEVDFVYELDRGRSFDGAPIEAHFDLTYYYSKDQQSGAPLPIVAKRYNVMQVHGKVAGYANMRMSRSVNYEAMDNPELPYEELPFGDESMPPEEIQVDKYSKARITARGFAISIRIAHKSAIEFPHVVQMISFLDDTPTRLDR